MLRIIGFALFFTLVVHIAGTARADTFVVGAGEAYTTVEAGLAAASAGDTVLVRRGTYDVAQLRPGSGVTLIGEDGPVFTKLFASGGGQAMLVEGVSDVRVEGFDIYSMLGVGPLTNALVYMEDSTDIYFSNCFFHDAPNDGDVLKMNNTQRFVVEDSIIWNPAPRSGTGYQECIDIRGHGDDSITVRGSWLFHEGSQGDYLLYAKGGTTNLLWENNVFGPSAGSAPSNVAVETGHLGMTDAGTAYESENFVVRGNLFVGLRGTGAFAFAGPRVSLLYNNVFYRNQDISRSLVELSQNPAEAGGPAIDTFCLNNIFHDNGDRTVFRVRDADSGTNLVRDYNLYDTGADGGDLALGDEAGSVTSDDPLFTAPSVPVFDPTEGTEQIQQILQGFRTETGSPARGAGTNAYDLVGAVHPTAIPEMMLRVDAFGTPRPATAWDIGLFQSCDGECMCTGGTTDCGGCVDTQVDDFHCGGCDMACGAATHCASGVCVADTDGGGTDAGPGPDVGPRPDGSTPVDSGIGGGTEDGGCGCVSVGGGTKLPSFLLPVLVVALLLRSRRDD